MIRLLQKTVKTITNETSNLPVLKPGCDRVTWSKILARAGFTWQSWKGQGIGRKSQTDSCIARSSSGNLLNIFMEKSLDEITCKFTNLAVNLFFYFSLQPALLFWHDLGIFWRNISAKMFLISCLLLRQTGQRWTLKFFLKKINPSLVTKIKFVIKMQTLVWCSFL